VSPPRPRARGLSGAHGGRSPLLGGRRARGACGAGAWPRPNKCFAATFDGTAFAQQVVLTCPNRQRPRARRNHAQTEPPKRRRFESVNFLEFVKLLAPFTARVSQEDKLNFLFTVFDVDGDGGARGFGGPCVAVFCCGGVCLRVTRVLGPRFKPGPEGRPRPCCCLHLRTGRGTPP
jgi:hypothetical protein